MNPSDYQYINYSVTNGVARIALNTPDSLNAFHRKMREELIHAIDFVEQDDSAKVVVLAGEGRAFSAGANLNEGLDGYPSFVEQCAVEYTPWLMGIHNSNKLYIAAVNGACAGVASAAAMNCDLMVMAEDAYIYQAFSAIGLMPDGGANWLLVNKLGYSRALQLAVDAGRLTAQQCFEYGLANKVVAADDLMAEAQAWGEKLAAGAPLAQQATKKLMRKVSAMSYQQVIEEESVMQSKLLQSEDTENAIKSFFAKEKAVFHGK